jgi:hypothetical protein
LALPQLLEHTPLYALVRLGKAHELEVPLLQLAWAPQHASSGLQVCVLAWLIAAVLSRRRVVWRYSVVIGLVAAAAFDASTWVGCVALLAATPVILLAAGILRLPKTHYLTALKTALPAIALCAILSGPILAGLFSGPSGYHSDHRPIGLLLFPSTYLGNTLGGPGIVGSFVRIVLYWIQMLPMCFGLIYLLGLPAMLAWLPGSLSERTFRGMAIAATIAYLLVSLFIRSTIAANDIGWRAANVPAMLMLIWAGIAVGACFTRGPQRILRWRFNWRC